jgi:predicted RNA-binding Zn-ribbon protein involved in translation (DUF1610 family)
MPSEVQGRAEAVDRWGLLGVYLTLLGAVLFLVRGSSISTYAFGLNAANWKSAVSAGALASLPLLGLGRLINPDLSSDELEKEPQSRGSIAAWAILTVLSSLSTEFWRVFCIAALTSLDTSAWLAVLIASLAYGAAQLQTSTARAAGACAFGGLAGFLFVKTGSLLAPLSMSLITGGADLYRARQTSPRAIGTVVPLKCPACSQNIHWLETPSGKWFPCPGCGQKLKRNITWGWQGCVFGITGTVAALFVLDLDFFWSLVLTVPLFFLFVILSAFFALMHPRFRTIEIYHDPHDPTDGKLFRF